MGFWGFSALLLCILCRPYTIVQANLQHGTVQLSALFTIYSGWSRIQWLLGVHSSAHVLLPSCHLPRKQSPQRPGERPTWCPRHYQTGAQGPVPSLYPAHDFLSSTNSIVHSNHNTLDPRSTAATRTNNNCSRLLDYEAHSVEWFPQRNVTPIAIRPFSFPLRSTGSIQGCIRPKTSRKGESNLAVSSRLVAFADHPPQPHWSSRSAKQKALSLPLFPFSPCSNFH